MSAPLTTVFCLSAIAPASPDLFHGLKPDGSSPPQRPPQQAQPQQCRERQRQAENPTFARARLGAQHVLDEALAAGHLGKALLIGGDAPDLLVRERRALVEIGRASCRERV